MLGILRIRFQLSPKMNFRLVCMRSECVRLVSIDNDKLFLDIYSTCKVVNKLQLAKIYLLSNG